MPKKWIANKAINNEPIDIGDEIIRQIRHAQENWSISGLNALDEVESLLVKMRHAMVVA